MRRVVITLARAGAMLSLFGAALPLYAQSNGGASKLYSSAITAMRSEDYSSAVQLFSQAQQAGLDTSTLHYNNGVALYKLGRYQLAKASFIKAEKGSESAALVHYNLGLTSYRQGKSDEARRWFQRVVTESKNVRLTEMAETMLSKLERSANASETTTAKPDPWSLIVDLKLGADDNVTLENSELAQASMLSDSYLDLYAAARYQLSGGKRDGYWGLLSASSLQYQQYGAYDYTQYDLGLFKEGLRGLLATRVGLRLSRSDVGGNSYLKKYTLRLQGDYHYSGSQLLRVRYDITRYDPIDSRYSYLAGLKGGLSLESLWHLDGRRYKVGYELESNSRDDYRLGNNFTSYSATRHEISASVTQPLIEKLQLTLAGDYRKSRYNDANVVAGVTDLQRKDSRWRWSLEAEYRLNRYLDLVAEYQYSNNDSNTLSKIYHRNQYVLGLQGFF